MLCFYSSFIILIVVVGLEAERIKLEQERCKLQLEQERNKGLKLQKELLPPLALPGARSCSTSSASSSQSKLPSISSNQSVSSSGNRNRNMSNSNPSMHQQKRMRTFERLYGVQHCPPTDAHTLKYKRKLNRKLKETNWALRCSLNAVSVVLNASKKDPVFQIDISQRAWDWKREYFCWKKAIDNVAGSAHATDEAKNRAILDKYKARTESGDVSSSNPTSDDSGSAPASGGWVSLVSLT